MPEPTEYNKRGTRIATGKRHFHVPGWQGNSVVPAETIPQHLETVTRHLKLIGARVAYNS